jgi:hypothetical protein
MKGGGNEKVIPLYKEPQNSPFIPNVQKQIFNDRLYEKGVYKNDDGSIQQKSQGSGQGGQSSLGNPLVNLQVYQPPKPKMDPPKLNPSMFLPTMVPGPFYPPQFNYQYGNAYPYMQAPIVKQYNISTSGPTDNHGRLAMIYEDMLPGKKFIGTLNTIGERINIHNFLRSIMFNKGDGQDVDLDGSGDNSLLGHLKFMDLNPYNTYKFSPNPYMGLPNGMLLYRSCYPIRRDNVSGSVMCAKNSVGMNIRIYKLLQGSYMINKQNEKQYKDYEEWREVAYYEYVREQIIKRKQCPNFVTAYGYYISENSKIDFDKIATIKGTPIVKEPKYVKEIPVLLRATPMQEGGANIQINMQLNPNAFTGKALVVLTESPHYNLFGWTSNTYQIDGNIKQMINIGYHEEIQWYSVLFQLMISMYVMQIHGIVFNEFTLEDNVFVKDLNIHGPITKYWKYKIDGIDYYVPNCGYLVMIDSNFKDIKQSTSSFFKNSAKSHKIYGKIFGEESDMKTNEIDALTFESFKTAFNRNAFDTSFIDNSGCMPPPDITTFMDSITNDISQGVSKNVGDYVFKFMRRFMNNRIGTYLTDVEKNNIRRDDHKTFIKGQMPVLEDSSGIYKFVLFIEEKGQGTAHILTKEDGKTDLIDKVVPISSLYNYSKAEPIVQSFKPNEGSLNDEEMLETYIVNKN